MMLVCLFCCMIENRKNLKEWRNMYIVIGILGIIFFLVFVVLFSLDRKNICWWYVGLLLVI